MFNPNTLNLKNITYLRKKYASFKNGINVDYDENILPVTYSINTYNFDYTNGALRDGLGINDPIVHYSYAYYEYTKGFNVSGKNVLCSYMYTHWHELERNHNAYMIIYCDDGKVYYNYLHTLLKYNACHVL